MPDTENAGLWRAPMWLNGRVTMTSRPSSTRARSPSCSCANLLTAYGTRRRDRRVFAMGLVRPGVDGGRSRDDDAGGAARPAKPVEQMMRRQDVAGERQRRVLPRIGHVRVAGAVIDRRRLQAPRAPAARDPRRAGRRRVQRASRAIAGGGSDRAQPTRSAVPARCSSRWLPAKPAAPVTRTTSFTLLAFSLLGSCSGSAFGTAPGSTSGTPDPVP